ncbi:hypothetical protein F5Y06DRAFT_305018 [Hypoxylon sp. FL0890]|nr:hypothetical protein F5Y06DRAFT_305018 [Hypoxylon sp. FL0890]
MHILKRLLLGASALFSRDNTLPAPCYDICNNAYIEAQQIGKTPALCASDSVFTAYYGACNICTTVQGGASNITELAPFIVYYIVTIGGVPTTWSFTTDVTIYASIPATTIVLITTTVNGALQTYTFTTTYAQLPTDFMNGAVSQSANGTDMPSPTPSPEPSESPNRAWIAGPVVGGVAGASIIMLGGLFLWRRRRRSHQASIRHELPSNDVVKSEMEVPDRPQELDASDVNAMHHGAGHRDEPHELAAERS